MINSTMNPQKLVDSSVLRNIGIPRPVPTIENIIHYIRNAAKEECHQCCQKQGSQTFEWAVDLKWLTTSSLAYLPHGILPFV